MITQERLRELFTYDALSGKLIRKIATARSVKVGQEAGRKTNRGYRQTMVDGARYMTHRLVWMYVHGRFPEHELDHINGIRDDNRLANLREATKYENQQNVTKRCTNKSGYLGVSLDKQTGKWKAQIRAYGKKKHIGLYDTPEEAHAAYCLAKSDLHGFQPTPRLAAEREFWA